MALKFVLDENLRGPLWKALQRHNKIASEPIDVVRVGDSEDLPLGTEDSDLIVWVERANRLIISHDKRTLLEELKTQLNLGRYSPGVLIIRRSSSIQMVVDFLALLAIDGQTSEFINKFDFIP